jgi:hypothetical protein
MEEKQMTWSGITDLRMRKGFDPSVLLELTGTKEAACRRG